MIVDRMHGQTEAGRSLAPLPSRRSKRRIAGAAALLALGLTAGCGATRPIKYYELAVPSGLAPVTAQALPITLIVGLPSAPALYRDNRVVYALADQQLGAYEYERWISPPPELIRDVVVRDLRATGRYAGVSAPQGASAGDYALRMRLYDFREQDSAGSLAARLTLDIELTNIKTGETVWQRYYNHDEPITAKTVPDVVAALSRNVQLAANDIASGLDQYFAAHPPK